MALMQIRLLAFGPARDAVGDSAAAVEVSEGATVADLLQAAEKRFPGLQPFRGRMAFARNAMWCSESTLLVSGDEVALIPPVSGG